MFILMLKYVKPLEEVDKHYEGHVQFLDKYFNAGKFICSGRRNPRTGGVILVNAGTEEEVKEIMTEDPFFKHQLADFEIIEFVPTRYDSRFSCFINN